MVDLGRVKFVSAHESGVAERFFGDNIDARLYFSQMLFVYANTANMVVRIVVVSLRFVEKNQLHVNGCLEAQNDRVD